MIFLFVIAHSKSKGSGPRREPPGPLPLLLLRQIQLVGFLFFRVKHFFPFFNDYT